jgi:hypothetical protein
MESNESLQSLVRTQTQRLAQAEQTREKLWDRPGGFAELPGGRIGFVTVFNFDNDEFEADEDVREAASAVVDVIGINGIEGDVAFTADLGIGAAWEFEVDREWDGVRHRFFWFEV